ncbi:MAG: accessory gene regulator B family protein [Lachnospiraceae bacterium]|nr:accessory gene regulator B family protein [Lachnospiraceae bacterium]
MSLLELSPELDREEREILEYGYRQLKVNALTILIVLVAAVVCNVMLQGGIFLLVFVPLRLYSGGYHADSQKKCAVISILALLICFMGIKWIPYMPALHLGISTMAAGIIVFMAPVANDVKRLDESEYKVYRYRTRIITGIIYVILLISTVLQLPYISKPIMMAYILVSISLILGYLKYQKKKAK